MVDNKRLTLTCIKEKKISLCICIFTLSEGRRGGPATSQLIISCWIDLRAVPFEDYGLPPSPHKFQVPFLSDSDIEEHAFV